MRECIFKRHFERRIKARHKAHLINVQANFVGLFSRNKTPMVVRCLDFNRYGMAISCDQRLKQGDKLEFSFRGRYISLDGIQGVVTSVTDKRHRLSSGEEALRYGIKFSYCQSTKDYSREIDNALSRIEGLFSQLDQNLEPQAS